jgi:biotin transport system permease protein
MTAMLALTSAIETPYHRLPAGPKLAALCLFTIGLFWLNNVPEMLGAVAVVLILTALPGRVFAGQALRMLRPLWPFAALLVAWHWWTDDLMRGAVILLRMAAAVAAANLVTMTTRLGDMMGVIEKLARPLAPFGLPPRRLALAVALVIRFIPVLGARQAALAEAWRARSARRAGWRVVPALTLAALEEADHVAESLRARGGTS